MGRTGKSEGNPFAMGQITRISQGGEPIDSGDRQAGAVNDPNPNSARPAAPQGSGGKSESEPPPSPSK